MRQLSDKYFVSPQIFPNDILALAQAGIGRVINNRPDGEALMQPLSQTISEAAQQSGLSYDYLPVSGGIPLAIVKHTYNIITQSDDVILAYCASGTRSALIWCFAMSPVLGIEAVLGQASQAGYELGHISGGLEHYIASSI